MPLSCLAVTPPYSLTHNTHTVLLCCAVYQPNPDAACCRKPCIKHCFCCCCCCRCTAPHSPKVHAEVVVAHEVLHLHMFDVSWVALPPHHQGLHSVQVIIVINSSTRARGLRPNVTSSILHTVVAVFPGLHICPGPPRSAYPCPCDCACVVGRRNHC